MPPMPPKPSHRVLAWVALLYVGQGLPYGVTSRILPVYFRVHGVSLAEIGLLSLLALPWSWKPLWAPLVDRFGSRRAWLVPCLALLALVTALVPLFPATRVVPALAALLFLFTIASATQDLALDAWAVDVISSRARLGLLNGIRSGAFRAALVAAGGGALLIAGAAGWSAAWLACAALFAALAVAAIFLPEAPRLERHGAPRLGLGDLWRWIARAEMAPIVAFALLYKLGDQALARMVEPFWVDRGLSLAEIALASNTLGLGLSIAGALAGGLFVARRGTVSGLLWLGAAQAVSNLGYLAVAALDLPNESLYVASAVENFAQGLGSAAFLSFLTLCCDRLHAATQYALLSALVSFSRDFAGALSGFGAERFGYTGYFALTTALAVPGLMLAFGLRRRVVKLERATESRAG